MDIRVVRAFIELFPQDRDIKCPYDSYDCLPNMDHNDTIYLYCLACNYKINVGLNLYDRMKRELGGIAKEGFR